MRQGIDQETPHTRRTQRNVQAGEDAERPRDASQNTDAVNTEQYPGLLRLTLILVSLYLSVFLIGLVGQSSCYDLFYTHRLAVI